MIRGLSPLSQKKPIQSPLDLRGLIKEHQDYLASVQEKRDALVQLHAQSVEIHDKSAAAHEAYTKDVEQRIAHLDSLIEEVKLIQKGEQGEKGEDGADGESVDHAKVVADVLKQVVVPIPKDGKDAKVDYEKVARIAATLIKPKEPKIDHAAIAETVLGLFSTGKKKLNIKHIDGYSEGLEQTLAPIRSLAAGFRGGGDVVTAGLNVTITTDANGKKVISATSGGGGLTALTATETPDGTATVFTFAAATAQPSYLVVDNVWMKATTKSGTVNWTWSAGLKQATLSIAPQDDIWAVV